MTASNKLIGLGIILVLLIGLITYELSIWSETKSSANKSSNDQQAAVKVAVDKAYQDYDNKDVTGEKAIKLLDMGVSKSLSLYFRLNSGNSFCLPTNPNEGTCRAFNWSTLEEGPEGSSVVKVSQTQTPSSAYYVHPQLLYHSSLVITNGRLSGIAFVQQVVTK